MLQQTMEAHQEADTEEPEVELSATEAVLADVEEAPAEENA